MVSVEAVLGKLKDKARPEQLERMVRFGMAVEQRPGVSVPDMKEAGKITG